MALLICLDCTAAFAVGIAQCPQCGSERSEQQGSDPYRGGDMPKSTRHGGVSYATDAGAEEAEEEVSSSAGSSSGTSPKKPETSQKTSARDRQKRARTTANRSSRNQAEDSAAGSTAGDGQKTNGSDND